MAAWKPAFSCSVRSPSGARQRPTGARHIAAAQRLLAAGMEFSRTTGDISGRISSRLRVGCFEPFGTPLLPGLLRRYAGDAGAPDIILREGDQNELRNWRVSGEIEMAVLYDGEIAPSRPRPSASCRRMSPCMHPIHSPPRRRSSRPEPLL